MSSKVLIAHGWDKKRQEVKKCNNTSMMENSEEFAKYVAKHHRTNLRRFFRTGQFTFSYREAQDIYFHAKKMYEYRYRELLDAVQGKHKDETRHKRALKAIRAAEKRVSARAETSQEGETNT